jgi:hypothetical protein
MDIGSCKTTNFYDERWSMLHVLLLLLSFPACDGSSSDMQCVLIHNSASSDNESTLPKRPNWTETDTRFVHTTLAGLLFCRIKPSRISDDEDLLVTNSRMMRSMLVSYTTLLWLCDIDNTMLLHQTKIQCQLVTMWRHNNNPDAMQFSTELPLKSCLD